MKNNQNFKGVLLHINNYFKTVKVSNEHLRNKLSTVYGFELQQTFYKHIKGHIRPLTMYQALIDTLRYFKYNHNTRYLKVFKAFINDIDFNEISKRQCYRLLNKMWGVFLENYTKLSANIYKK